MARCGRAVLVLLIALVVVGATPGVIPAAEAGGHEAKPNIFDPRLDLTIWTIIVFAALLFVLGKFAWGPMLEGLQKREQSILGAIAEAQKAREEAQRLQAQWQQEMARAQDKVREIHEEARRRAEQNTAEMTAKARADIQAERERLHREIQMARDQAVQELWNQTARLATEVSARVIRRQLSPEDQRRLVDEALAELKAAGDKRQRQTAGVQG